MTESSMEDITSVVSITETKESLVTDKQTKSNNDAEPSQESSADELKKKDLTDKFALQESNSKNVTSKDSNSSNNISLKHDSNKSNSANSTKDLLSDNSAKNVDVEDSVSTENEVANEIIQSDDKAEEEKEIKVLSEQSEVVAEAENQVNVNKEKEVESTASKETESDALNLGNKDLPEENNMAPEGEHIEKDASVKMEEQLEVGIVGPPTAVSEIINEEELRAESAISTEEKIHDHVAEWVQKSVTTEALITAETEEDENRIQTNSRRRRRNRKDKRNKKKGGDDAPAMPTRKSQRIVSNIIKRSIKCLNKMHAMEGGTGGNGKKVDAADKSREEDTSRASPKVPQNQQNGAALPEETAAATSTADRLRSSAIKKEPLCDSESESTGKPLTSVDGSQQKAVPPRTFKSDNSDSGRKRKSTDEQLSANGGSTPKKFCIEQREQYISSLVGCDKVTAEELAARADQLRAEVQALDELARAKEMEWNEILSMRKLKEEAYLRVERRRQVLGFMEGNRQLGDSIPPASLSLGPEWESSGSITPVPKEKGGSFETKDDVVPEESSRDSPAFKKEKSSKSASHRQTTPPKQSGENGRKQSEAMSPENRQIGEGRQGAIVDVRSIIADYRLRHPEMVPRRGRRMRNSVNVGLGAGGAVVETGPSVDSRPSSTDSCKSNPNATDSNNSMSFKDVLVQFAKLSQQQGEPVKTPQNYPDVTLHPVAPSPSPQTTQSSQATGSLLHGILTKSQSPRPTTFSPTLARLLTAPERERNAPIVTSIPQQSAATQHLLQAYQGSNPVSISDLLSSSKARTEITITPVVNTAVQSHSNNLIQVDDVEEEAAVIEDRESRIGSGGRDTREDRDSPPRCQGCHERAAQFVCAGCGNQWYCSRECQVAAWDEHSEVCSG